MADSPSPGWLFHRLAVHLSARVDSVDKLSHLGCPSLIQQVLNNYPTLFLSQGSFYTISTTSNTFLLATYLSLSSNVFSLSTKQNLTSTSQSPTMKIKSLSTHFSSLPSILSDTPNHLLISLPDGSSYQVPCIPMQASWYSLVERSPLLANIRFAVNSRQQLMCLVTSLSKEVSPSGERMVLTTKHSNLTHIPLWAGSEGGKDMMSSSRVFVRSDLRRKDKQVCQEQQVLAFQAWEKLIELGAEHSEGGAGEGSIADIISKLSKEVEGAANEKRLLAVLAQYTNMFTVEYPQISLMPPSPSYWSQLLLLCSNLTPATGLAHVPLSPAKLGVTLGNNKVVLRQLQGLALPSEKNMFSVTFRFSEADDDGFLVTLPHSKLKVPNEGKLIPLTLVMHVTGTRGVVVVPSLGSWRGFNVNWPKDETSLRVEKDLVDDFELLLDVNPVLSSAVGYDNDIVTLEEELQIK
eukprot:GFUD01016058.1.p1 GENE.GFUD01016058.1~~GFUD01016058.1.p1  ORF type:complete len:464 (+),score=160.44 GFUD01016058.1:47-1438(+)